MGDTVFTVLCGIGVLLCIVPGIWHIQHRNIPIISLLFWLITSNLVSFVNSIIWVDPDPLESEAWVGLGYCDVTIKITLAKSVGILASITALIRYLANIMKASTSFTTREARRQRLIQDCIICIFPPVFVMGIHYIVQPNRYIVYGLHGCKPSVHPSWLRMGLISIWPAVFCVVASSYSILLIARYIQRRRRVGSILQGSGLNESRFIRLVLMSLIILCYATPLTFVVLVEDLKKPKIKYSWAACHWEHWDTIPASYNDQKAKIDHHYISPVTAFITFAFFGFGPDAMGMYRRCLRAIGIPLKEKDFVYHPNSQSNSTVGFQNSLSSKSNEGFRLDQDDETLIGVGK